MRIRRRTFRLRAAVVVGVAAIVLGFPSAPVLADSHVGCTSEPLEVGPLDPTLSRLLSAGAPAPPPPPGTPAPPPRPVHDGASGAAREALGPQFAMLWVRRSLQGWVVGLAPGPLEPAPARAAIVEALGRRYSPEEVAYLADRLHISRQPYGEAELRPIADQIGNAARAYRLPTGIGIRCTLSDAFRVEVTLFNPERSPELLERAQAIVAPFGDRVRLEDSFLGPAPITNVPLSPPPTVVPPAPEPVGRYVAMANGRRCIRGPIVRVAVRSARRSEVSALTVRAGAYRRTIRAPRLTQAIRVNLRGRRSRVEVSVRLRDGRLARETVTLTRCR